MSGGRAGGGAVERDPELSLLMPASQYLYICMAWTGSRVVVRAWNRDGRPWQKCRRTI